MIRALRLAILLAPVLGWGQTNWVVPQVLRAVGYSSAVRQQGCHGTNGCTVLLAPSQPPPQSFGNLTQTFDAAPYRGRVVRVHAWVRVEAVEASDHAQLWLRVDLPGHQTGFLDNMGDRPISSAEWRSYEITGEVAPNAESISVGVMGFGKGRVWVDSPAFEIVPNAAAGTDVAAARDALQKLYARIDQAYTQGDMDAVASLALPDARIRMGSTVITLSAALLQIMGELEKGSKYRSTSTVTGVRLSGADAIVSVNNESTLTSVAGRQTLLSSNRDTWTRAGGAWKLKESALISSRSVIPPTDPETAKVVAAELKQRAAPLATVQPASTTDDLAAFGKAVGDARLVALGEATRGTREFFQMKHRLLEYLVREKGFTVFAIEANWPETEVVDHYVKTGEGDPKTALAGMNQWTWYTQEMLDLIEWMRDYNKAPGTHSMLTFTGFDMQGARGAAQWVLDYLGHFSPDDAGPAAEAYAEVQDLEARRGQVYDDKAKAVSDRAATVMKALDLKRTELVRQSSAEAWRDARQAAAIVYQSCAMRIPGKGPAYRDEAMAGNIEWLAGSVHASEKIVLWAHNGQVGFGAGAEGGKTMGAWLRERYGPQFYSLGFAFRRGQLRAIGTEDGRFTPVAVQTAPASPEGSGDAVLNGAGVPLFFLDLRTVPGGPLGRWLGEPHLFHEVGANWVIGGLESNLEAETLGKRYDGLIFVEESRPTVPPQ